MRVRHHIKNIAARFVIQRLIGGDAAGHVVAKGDKIDGRLQRIAVGVSDVQFEAVFAEIAQHIARIRAAALYIAKELPAAIFLQGLKHVFRLAA